MANFFFMLEGYIFLYTFSKGKEIEFINTLEAQNKRHEIMSKHQVSEARLQDIQVSRTDVTGTQVYQGHIIHTGVSGTQRTHRCVMDIENTQVCQRHREHTGVSKT